MKYALSEDAYHDIKEQFDIKLNGGPISSIFSHPDFCAQGIITADNLACLPHPDPCDGDGYGTPMTVVGDFEGGQARFPQARIRCEYRPGDLMFVQTKIVLHAVENFAGEFSSLPPSPGCRHALMAVWRQALWDLDFDNVDWPSLKRGVEVYQGPTKRDYAYRRDADDVALSKRRREREEGGGGESEDEE
ncbi:hypothetical protein OF846_000737 [Rhodotorula toruloides]|nr:hypothetical protein OF846_000737 [Rhodotorula toruloides]